MLRNQKYRDWWRSRDSCCSEIYDATVGGLRGNIEGTRNTYRISVGKYFGGTFSL